MSSHSKIEWTARDAAFQAWKRKAEDADILQVALSKPINAKLRKAGSREWVGPCPVCLSDKGAASDRFSVNPFKGLFNCRGSGGGDIIAMVMHACGVEFLAAVEIITGEPPPDGSPSNRPIESPEDIARREAEREACDKQRAGDDNVYRERERERLFYGAWKHGQPAPHPILDAYFWARLNCTFDELPRGLRLRCIEDAPYYFGGAKDAVIVHRGPVMLAPIQGAASVGDQEKFSGLHHTFLDLAQPKGKLILKNPEDGDLLPAKKVRGSKAGGHIALVSIADPKVLVIGEGIEKTLAMFLALKRGGRDLSLMVFWTSVDLGNLGGKAKATVRHPTAKDARGRARRVPGPTADLDAPGISIPSSVDEVVILGDRSSDRFTTECSIERAVERFSRKPDGSLREVTVLWSPDNADFDDLLRLEREARP